jgi:hypothetical protein
LEGRLLSFVHFSEPPKTPIPEEITEENNTQAVNKEMVNSDTHPKNLELTVKMIQLSGDPDDTAEVYDHTDTGGANDSEDITNGVLQEHNDDSNHTIALFATCNTGSCRIPYISALFFLYHVVNKYRQQTYNYFTMSGSNLVLGKLKPFLFSTISSLSVINVLLLIFFSSSYTKRI